MSVKTLVVGLANEGGGMGETVCIGGYERLIKSIPPEQLKYFAGTSAGSIFASMLAARASIDYIKNKYMSTDFSLFKDSSWNIAEDLIQLKDKFGWYRGDALEAWHADIMRELTGNPDITFAGLLQQFGTVLIVTGVDVLKKKCRLVVMDYRTTPNMSVHSAIRRSSSIPLAFQAIFDDAKHVYVDGGVLLNYPLELLYDHGLSRDQVIGMSLASPSDPKDLAGDGEPVGSIFELIEAIATTWREQAMNRHLSKEDWERTCKIPVSIGAMEFNAPRDKLDEAIATGYNTMDSFLALTHT
jgi:NTE family protein